MEFQEAGMIGPSNTDAASTTSTADTTFVSRTRRDATERKRLSRQRERERKKKQLDRLHANNKNRKNTEYASNELEPVPSTSTGTFTSPSKPKTNAERQAAYRKRKRDNAMQLKSASVTTSDVTAARSTILKSDSMIWDDKKRNAEWDHKWWLTNGRFKSTFKDNDFGHACSVCDTLWFRRDLTKANEKHVQVIIKWHASNKKSFTQEEARNKFLLCANCKKTLGKKKMPALAKYNGVVYPERPPILPELRFAVNFEVVKKEFDMNDAKESNENKDVIKELESVNEYDMLIAMLNAMMWNEHVCIMLAPEQNSMSLVLVKHAEELTFRKNYFREVRVFNPNAKVTSSCMISTSEIRRLDRREVRPDKILHMAKEVLRLRMGDGIRNTSDEATENISRRTLEDEPIPKKCLEKNLAFPKSVPNSAQYWSNRKQNLFAMIRQLGKPTAFMTLSACEVQWPDFLELLNKLSGRFPDVAAEDLSKIQRCVLVIEDPVICCVYFHKLVHCIMNILKTELSCNPLGRYRVTDSFTCIEFQNHGSPQAHILLWLENDPKELIGEHMPETVAMMDYLCTVDVNALPSEALYANQIHRHSSSCREYVKDVKQSTTSKGKRKNRTEFDDEQVCRFNIPYWPSEKTRVLVPKPLSDNQRKDWQSKYGYVRRNLQRKYYETFEEFLADNKLTPDLYLDVIRSTLRKPTLLLKRNMSQIQTNMFLPWVSGTLRSNMDFKIILDADSCAEYVVEYMNKSTRGIRNLRLELKEIFEACSDRDYREKLKSLNIDSPNRVEMTSQEAAWYLLSQLMSEASRDVVYIPTVLPAQRHKSRKCKRQTNAEYLTEDCTDVWTKNIVQRYEERSEKLETVYLAEFGAWYNYGSEVGADNEGTEEYGEENVRHVKSSSKQIKKRDLSRIIRYHGYSLEDTWHYKREMVMLYLPFRNEHEEILDRGSFVTLYDENEDLIKKRRKTLEAYIDDDKLMDSVGFDEAEQMTRPASDEPVLNAEDDVKFPPSISTKRSKIDRRSNVMSEQEYCERMRLTNAKQRELVHEAVHRIHEDDVSPIQVFCGGPAGCGKSFIIELLVETYNQYSQQQRSGRRVASVACASTGKSAVDIHGRTVHSAFRISISNANSVLSSETLSTCRNNFRGVKSIFVDEISMLSHSVFTKMNKRLQEITEHCDRFLGGLDLYAFGDFRQLPPVLASSCYSIPANHMGGSVLWQELDYFQFKQVLRQTNNTFSSLLTKIGDGQRLNKSELKLIESRHRTEKWCDANVRDATRLFHTNRDVDLYNKKVIKNPYNHLATDLITSRSSEIDMDSARRKLVTLTVADTGGLPYTLPLAVGYPYLITSNIDVDDGLANGTIGTLKYIELEKQKGTVKRLWFEFPHSRIGAEARKKESPYTRSRSSEILTHWTPINQVICYIPLTKTIKCKREQFSLVPACALTVHKSQGSTFDKIVFKYSPKQQHQLVYVALSRVTSLDGLHVITENDAAFLFTHGRKMNNSHSMRNVRDEYRRLEKHPLATVTKSSHKFCDREVNKTANELTESVLVLNLNISGLNAHAGDVETDEVLKRCEYLSLTETCLRDDDPPVKIKDYVCVTRMNNCTDRQSNAAGGVAIYKHISSPTVCKIIEVGMGNEASRVEKFGDICLAEITVRINDKLNFTFLLGSVYVYPGTSAHQIADLLYQALAPYVLTHHPRFVPDCKPDSDMPIVLCGDFNIDVRKDSHFIGFLKDKFNLDCRTDLNLPTTFERSCLDLTFTRHITVETHRYVSYFSSHRPILNRVIAELHKPHTTD